MKANAAAATNEVIVKRRNRYMKHVSPYLFIAPAIIGLIILNIWPFIQSIGLSLVDKHTEAFGLSNYIRMFTADDSFWRSNLNTVYFTLLTVPVGVFLALILAVLLNNKIRGRNLYRAIFFLPLVCAPTAIALMWRWIVFNSNTGFLNHFLSIFGIDGVKWLSDPNVIMMSISMVAIWGSVGYDIVILLAGLQTIPSIYYEAALIDGAGPIKRFRHITIPLISPTLFFVIVMRTMTALRQFDLCFMFARDTDLTFQSAQTLLYQFYRETFMKLNANYGSAIVVWTVLLILVITVGQFIMEKKWVHYDL